MLLASSALFAQTVASSIVGAVTDPAAAVVPGAEVQLVDTRTGAVRTALTDNSGLFRFPNVAPSVYSVTVKAAGFKSHLEREIALSASETRDLGRIALEIGSMTEQIAITAEATPVQVASSEKSQTIDGRQLNDITIKGRDLFGYLKLVPGVIDTTASRDVTSPNAIGGISINGNTSAKNFTVDGITDIDTGSNGTLHYEPNIDAIQELKVLTSNYQAEFGRNSGGTITVITKSGTQQFHGTAAWNHRHEGFNANTWANNRNGRNALGVPVSQISPYRFNVETYSIGGPVYIPGLFNREKKKLFFFWSQEYTGQFVPGGTQNKYTPTAAERGGDFSRSFLNNGSLVVIKDPTTGVAFPGNTIPASRIDPTGLAMLNYFPLPNFTATQSSQLNVVNYFESASAQHPRRNDVLRVDTYATSKLTAYFRWINDHDDLISLYQGVQFTRGTGGTLGDQGIAPIDHPNPGHGYSGSATWSVSPTMINEATVAKSWNTWSWYTTDNYKSIDRSLVNNPATLFALPKGAPSGASATNGYQNLMPQMSFGSPPSNSMSYTRNSTSAGAYENFNTIWTFQDNLSKVLGKHTIKTGFYIEHNQKIQPSGGLYAGSYSFAPDPNNSLNTGDGYANALLGNVTSYSQQTARAVFNTVYWNHEFYVQDNWRVSRRLTLDYGIRLYHQTPQIDLNKTFADFVPSQYSKTAVPRLYIPGTSAGKRVAVDPGTGALAPVAYIGLFVPNSGNPASGYRLLGADNNPFEPYHQRPDAPAPRIGFAYDLNGEGKTAIRGGFGIFYNRLDGNQVYNMSGQPPYAYTPTISYTTFSQIAASGGNLVFGPVGTTNTWPVDQNVPWDRVHNASLEVQRGIGNGTVVTVGYVGNWGYHQNLTTNINYIPIGTRAPFNKANADPTNGNRSLPDIFLRTIFPGVNTINSHNFVGHTNYHAFQATVQRRYSHGLAWGLSYTWSRAMGTTAFTNVVPDNEAWNYGRLSTDRRHNLQVNYSYDLPSPGHALNSRLLAAFLDHWTLSGIFSMQSGAPFTPGFSINGATVDYTGTPDIGARLNVVGDPWSNVPAGLYYNPAAFAPPALGTTITTPVLGTAGGGAGLLTLPRVTNVDATMAKFIPLFGERKGLRLQVQAYNALNHPQFNSVGGLQFNTAGAQTSLGAGIFSGTLPARILAFGARLEF